MVQQKFLVRHILGFICIASALVGGILLPKFEHNHDLGWVIGSCFGLAETLVVVFPLIKIRHFFTEFEKKIFASGAFVGIQLSVRWILNYIVSNYVI